MPGPADQGKVVRPRSKVEVGELDLGYAAPGHDAWVEGDEANVLLELIGLEMSRDLMYLYGMGRTRLSGALGRLEETGRLDHEPRAPYALRSVEEDGHLEGSRGLAIAG